MNELRCKSCEKEIDIDQHELYHLYDKEEDLHEVECPHCEHVNYIRPVVIFEFTHCDSEGEEII